MTDSGSVDRVLFNEPGNWLGPDFAVGLVDEVVASNATVRLEMLGDHAAYMSVVSDRVNLSLNVFARPSTWRERRQILACDNDRLWDHVRSLNPWSDVNVWFVPWWRRPWSAVSAWWGAVRAARAVLLVKKKD
jgi:hypothetical protein